MTLHSCDSHTEAVKVVCVLHVILVTYNHVILFRHNGFLCQCHNWSVIHTVTNVKSVWPLKLNLRCLLRSYIHTVISTAKRVYELLHSFKKFFTKIPTLTDYVSYTFSNYTVGCSLLQTPLPIGDGRVCVIIQSYIWNKCNSSVIHKNQCWLSVLTMRYRQCAPGLHHYTIPDIHDILQIYSFKIMSVMSFKNSRQVKWTVSSHTPYILRNVLSTVSGNTYLH